MAKEPSQFVGRLDPQYPRPLADVRPLSRPFCGIAGTDSHGRADDPKQGLTTHVNASLSGDPGGQDLSEPTSIELPNEPETRSNPANTGGKRLGKQERHARRRAKPGPP